MAIIINIDVMLAKRKMSVTELSEKVGITMANLSILKNEKAKAIRFSTLEAICKALDCQPGDILEYKNNEATAVPTEEATAEPTAEPTDEPVAKDFSEITAHIEEIIATELDISDDFRRDSGTWDTQNFVSHLYPSGHHDDTSPLAH